MKATWRTITFNIRRSECLDGDNRWEMRSPHVIEWINKQRPHIIGFQETMPDAVTLLVEHMPGYEWAGCGRGEALDDEHCRIAWRADEFTAIRWETFWLSDTPCVPGSKFTKGNAYWPRTCTMAELYSKTTSRRLRVYNTHLDHECDYSKQAGISVLCRHIAQQYQADPLPFLLMGDFNATPDSDVVQRVHQFSPVPLTDFSTTDGMPVNYTYHGYGLQEPCKIDYLLGSSEWILEDNRFETWQRDGIYLSDHFPVIADLSLQ